MITKKKRWIMQDCGHTTFTTPAVLAEIYDKQLCEYGFRNKTEVLIYLATGLWNEEHGIKNSWFVRDILSRTTPERSLALSCLPRVYRGLHLTDEEKGKVLSISNYKYLSNLMNAVLEAFMAAKSREKRLLRKEMHAQYVYESNNSYWMQTNVRDDQHTELCQMAWRNGLTFLGMIRTAIDAILFTEGLIPETWFVPFEVQDTIQDHLRVEGFTLHHFSREVQIRINMGDEMHYKAICNLIRRYDIPGTAEFLRRVLLFLLNSKDIPDLRVSDDYPNESEDVYFDENETYTNNRLSRKDFVRSIYQ